ncbi:SGNH/GDSL hydrolase family protein [candidate division CSSED10-310 bacterium]|uniref:SGNH/GDSL hydrolase family protein n=1 Tax=candidate division CSSED10-310 bacterium TaxID=2855610 RepID=A0ABV6Z5F6_UNCC1
MFSRKSYVLTAVILIVLSTVTLYLLAKDKAYVPEEGSPELDDVVRKVMKLDPKLPFVLIIGDSISIGYTPYVKKILGGKANVIHAPGNNQGTTLGRQNLKNWLGKTEWDIIHFNWGLHDLKHVKVVGTAQNSDDPNDPQQADIRHYKNNMKILVKELKETGAKLIFATTTPYPNNVSPSRIPEDAQKYNEVALKIMKENGVEINDLYTFILPKLKEVQKPINVHFEPEGSEILGEMVAEAIMKNLAIHK